MPTPLGIYLRAWLYFSNVTTCSAIADAFDRPSHARLTPEVQQQLMTLGDPWASPRITDRQRRPVVDLSSEEQTCWVTTVVQPPGKLRRMTVGSPMT
jgi:hypothetical protein